MKDFNPDRLNQIRIVMISDSDKQSFLNRNFLPSTINFLRNYGKIGVKPKEISERLDKSIYLGDGAEIFRKENL